MHFTAGAPVQSARGAIGKNKVGVSIEHTGQHELLDFALAEDGGVRVDAGSIDTVAWNYFVGVRPDGVLFDKAIMLEIVGSNILQR